MSATHSTPQSFRHTDAHTAVVLLARSLARGKKALWVGEQLSAREAPLAEAARNLRAYSKLRPTAKLANTRARPLDARGVRPKPGSVEVMVVPNTEVLGGPLNDHLPQLRAGLCDEGALVVGVPLDMTRRALESLQEAVAEHFAHHEVLGFAPFVGWTLASLQREASALRVQDSLMDAAGTAPTHIIVIASSEPIEIDPVTIVLAPVPEPMTPSAPPAVAFSKEGELRLKELESLRVEAADHVAQLEAALQETANQVETLRGELSKKDDEAPEPAPPQVAPSEEIQADFALLEDKLQLSAKRIRELESELEHRGVLVRDLLEEMDKPAHATPPAPIAAEQIAVEPSAKTPAADGEAIQANQEVLRELRDFLSDALAEQSLLPPQDSNLSDTTLVGMEAPTEWADAPPGGLDDLRARLDWMRSRAQIEGPTEPPAGPAPDGPAPAGPAPDGPIQLATIPPNHAAPPSADESELGEFGQELMLLHERLAQLDDEIEQERHTRQSLQAEVERLESSDAASALSSLKERLREVRDEVESAQAHPGDPPDLDQLRDLLRSLAEG